jgi:putative adenylate-forming enzyme
MMEKFSILAAYIAKRSTLALLKDRSDVEKRQRRLLKKLMQHACEKFSFYAPYKAVEFSAWPIIDKPTLMQNFTGMNARGLTGEAAWAAAEVALKSQNVSAVVGDLTIGTSTGTSGQRGLFIVSAAERSLWLGSILARCLPDFPFARHRIAVMLATGNNLYNTASQSGRLAFAFFDLKKGLDCHKEALEKFAPDVLIATPHAVRTLADLGVALKLQHVFTGGEVLDPIDAAVIETRFGVKPRSIYQATEGFLGVACEHGHIHLNEDDMLFEEEPVKDHPGHFTPIITDLRRRTQAMIRYRLNDILVKHAEPCSCGSPLQALERVEGRSDDVLQFRKKHSTETVSIMPEALRAAILDCDRAIQDFQLVQHAESSLELKITSSQFSVSSSTARASLLNYLKLIGVSDELEVTVSNLASQEKDYGKKLRRIHRQHKSELR